MGYRKAIYNSDYSALSPREKEEGKLYKMRRESAFFFIIALCATIPFLFMDRQHHYYFMPAMAYWMLGFAILMEQNPWPWGIQRKMGH